VLGEQKTTVLQGIQKKQFATRSFEEEIIEYKASGLSTDDILLFEIGFDEVCEFSKLTSYPIFKLYFKEERLCYIVFSNYRINSKYYQDWELDNGVRFMDSQETVLDKMGKYESFERLQGYDGIWKYHQKGLELIFDENKLRTIHFFEAKQPKTKPRTMLK